MAWHGINSIKIRNESMSIRDDFVMCVTDWSHTQKKFVNESGCFRYQCGHFRYKSVSNSIQIRNDFKVRYVTNEAICTDNGLIIKK